MFRPGQLGKATTGRNSGIPFKTQSIDVGKLRICGNDEMGRPIEVEAWHLCLLPTAWPAVINIDRPTFHYAGARHDRGNAFFQWLHVWETRKNRVARFVIRAAMGLIWLIVLTFLLIVLAIIRKRQYRGPAQSRGPAGS